MRMFVAKPCTKKHALLLIPIFISMPYARGFQALWDSCCGSTKQDENVKKKYMYRAVFLEAPDLWNPQARAHNVRNLNNSQEPPYLKFDIRPISENPNLNPQTM